MSLRAHLGPAARASGAGLLSVALALQAGAARPQTPHASARFVVAHTYAPSTALPGSLTCVGPSFCLQLAFPSASLLASASVLATHDGGRSWRALATLPFEAGGFSYVSEIACSSVTVCAAGGEGSLLGLSRDGGRTWTVHDGLPESWSLGRNVTCVADGACVAVGLEHHVFRTLYLAPGAPRFVALPTATLPLGFVPTALSCASVARCVLDGAERGVDGLTLTSGRVDRAIRWHAGTLAADWVVRSLSCPVAARCYALRAKDRLTRAGTRTRVVQQEVVVARTDDAGATWTDLARPAGQRLPTSIACSSVEVCVTSLGLAYGEETISVLIGGARHPSARASFGVGGVPVMTTVDGGRRWRRHAVLPAIPGVTMSGAAACLTGGSCVADGANADGGGRTEVGAATGRWQLVSTESAATGATSLVCTDGSTCYRVDEYQGLHGYDAVLRVSHDDGATWAAVGLPAGAQPVALGGCQDESTCELVAVTGVSLAGGEQGAFDYANATLELLTTTDGGTTWSTSVIGTDEVVSAASCSSVDQCVVLEQVGVTQDSLPAYLASTQDGHTWATTPVAPPGGLFDLLPFETSSTLSCAAPGTCLFAEDTQDSSATTVLRSADGGATWIVTTPPGPPGDDVDGASCVAPSTCDLAYASQEGGAGYLTQTTDGGASWSTASAIPGTAEEGGVDAIDCTASADCTAVLAPGAEVTSNAGSTWTALGWPRSSPGAIESVSALSCSATTCLAADSSLSFPDLFNPVASLGGSITTTTRLLRLTS